MAKSPSGDTRGARKLYLTTNMSMSESEAELLIKRDEDEETKWGQQLSRTFHLADVFIEMRADKSSTSFAYTQIERFLDLLFGRRIISPSKDEYGMYLAQAAALRSADLSRQVGAAILNGQGEVLSLGTNEVPAAGGGQYWGEDEDPDYRDFKKGHDFNEIKKREVIEEILAIHDLKWSEYSPEQREQFKDQLEATRAANLIEFGRAVHAEMEAILSAARRGVAIRDATLYTTTFPCHNCAKHIVGAGIRNVIYVEPYPKSLALEMHEDSIGFIGDLAPQAPAEQKAENASGEHLPTNKVWFRPFVGISPRRYPILFSCMSEEGMRYKRKMKGGALSTEPIGLRLRAPILSHIDREALAAEASEGLGNSG